jgi:hypothetical protein
MNLSSEISARKSLTQAVYECLLAHRNRWVSAEELAQVRGFCAWRTRVSNARDLAAEFGDVILWNGQTRGASAYMLRAKPLARDASQPMPTESRWLF